MGTIDQDAYGQSFCETIVRSDHRQSVVSGLL